MKQMVVRDHHAGERIIFMPESFEIKFDDLGDMLFVNFCKIGEKTHIFSIPLFFDDDEHYADINRFKESERKRIIRHLIEEIIDDVNEFMSEKPDEDYYEIFPLKYSNYFDTDEFRQRWYVFYEAIIDTPEIYKDKKKKNKKRNKK